jgi:hypothetical protein
MRTPRRGLTLAAGAFTFVLAACKDTHTVRIDANNATLTRRDTTQGLGPGDLRIATTDSAIELALVGDSLVAGFGASTREQIRKATDTSTVSGTGFGASIERIVKSSVAGALDHEMHVPLSEISAVRYEDGLLVFYDRNGKRTHYFEHDRRDHGDARDSRFSESDAKAFITVFKSKTGRS